MAKICPLTNDKVLYLDCNECEWKNDCKDTTEDFMNKVKENRDARRRKAESNNE